MAVLRRPVRAGDGANAKPVLFGDWSRYFVRMVNGIKFEMSRDFHFDTDQTTFRAILRADGAMIDTSGAIKYLRTAPPNRPIVRWWCRPSTSWTSPPAASQGTVTAPTLPGL